MTLQDGHYIASAPNLLILNVNLSQSKLTLSGWIWMDWVVGGSPTGSRSLKTGVCRVAKF